MLSTIVQALYYFLPAYAANAAPVLLQRYKILESMKVPVDFKLKMGGNFLFGATKTYRGLAGGAAAGAAVCLLQALIHSMLPQREYLYLFPYSFSSSLLLGFLMGLGEGLGDLFKSFVKRRFNMKSGEPAFLLDQSSFLGALLLSSVIYVPPQGHLLAIILVSPVIPAAANLIAFKAGWKKVWW